MGAYAKRAALYIRVSSDEQAMHGYSLQAQKQALYSYAKEHEYKVVGLYADEGVTARKKYKNRAEFMRMLRDVESDTFDVILFIKLDRWFRNVSDYYEVQRTLDAHDVQWIATEERYDTTTANGRLNLNIRLSIAQDESDRTAERIKFVFEDKVRRGEVISGKVPLGYKIENKHLVIDQDECKIVREIFQHYQDTRSIRETRKWLMDAHGTIYSPTGLRYFLQRELYIGRKNGADDFCEPIIDKGQFDFVQTLIKERAQRSSPVHPERVYLFSSIVFCKECGNRLSAHVTAGKYIYYRCTRYEKLHLCIHKKRTSEMVLEDWLLKNLARQFEEYNASIQHGKQRQPSVDVAKIKAKMRKLKELYLNDLIELEEYKQDYAALKRQCADNQKPETPAAPVDLSWLNSALESYRTLDRPHKKTFWSRMVGRIIIDNDDNFSVTPAPISPYR